jgi:hypothetical protein
VLLKPGPQGLMLVDGRTRVIASYSPGDGGPGALVLDFENQETFESRQRRVRLDPWRKGAFELFEWKQGNALFLCGAEQLLSLDPDHARCEGLH